LKLKKRKKQKRDWKHEKQSALLSLKMLGITEGFSCTWQLYTESIGVILVITGMQVNYRLYKREGTYIYQWKSTNVFNIVEIVSTFIGEQREKEKNQEVQSKQITSYCIPAS
jgi:hypothetical protein